MALPALLLVLMAGLAFANGANDVSKGVATLVGSALLWNSLLTLLLAVLMAVPLFVHTVVEEVLFEQHFGDAYRDYQRRVPRLVPFVRGVAAADPFR